MRTPPSFTMHTPIPTVVRGQIRALVRAHPDFKMITCGVYKSRNIPNKALLRFAIFIGGKLRRRVAFLLTNAHLFKKKLSVRQDKFLFKGVN